MMAYDIVLFEDNNGRLLQPDEVNEISPWEIERRGIHVAKQMRRLYV